MSDFNNIKDLFLKFVSIDSPSGEEGEIREFLKKIYSSLGVHLNEDEYGNLYAEIEGEGDYLLLSSHMDTVNPGRGKKAVVKDDGTITSDGTTVLGADDYSGLTEIYEVIKYIKENNVPHRPVELLFTTGEELYCVGAKQFDYRKIKAKQAYVLDLSGAIGRASYAAPTIISFEAVIHGKAAHAGFNPEEGIHAIQIAARAIGKLKLGRVKDGVTGNVGIIQGGTGTNIVPGEVTVKGEIRSLVHEEGCKLLKEYRKVFEEEAGSAGAKVSWKDEVHIRAYETPPDSSVVLNYEEAVRKAGLNPSLEKTFGGSDQNVFSQYGIEGVVIANSMYNAHSVQEYTNIHEMEKIVEILKNILQQPVSV
ncbi:MAG: M20/M25/M40 family metallo-hydrolase [Lachnospira sp.]